MLWILLIHHTAQVVTFDNKKFQQVSGAGLVAFCQLSSIQGQTSVGIIVFLELQKFPRQIVAIILVGVLRKAKSALAVENKQRSPV